MSSATLPLWGQAWELTAIYATPSGDSEQVVLSSTDWTTEPLRITFEVQKIFADSPYWYADISVYNLTDDQTLNTFLNATWVILKAGFQSGACRYSTIWESGVFQVLYDRERVVDQKVTFHCVANPANIANPIAVAVGPLSSQNDIVAAMVQAIGLPPVSPSSGTQSQTALSLMSSKRYPRGNGVFGSPNLYFNNIAVDNKVFKFHDGRKVYIADFNTDDWTPDLYYAPAPAYTGTTQTSLPSGVTASIIGDPQQTQYGIDFTVLLDPRLTIQVPPLIVELDQSTFFRQLPYTPGASSELPSRFTPDLKFLVGRVTHRGDSRGNVWYTDVTAFTSTYAQLMFSGKYSPDA